MRIHHHTAAGAVRAGTLSGALQPRIVGLAENLSGPSWFAMLVEAGTAQLTGDDTLLSGPVLAWRPWNREARARFSPGTAGTYVILGPTALANTVGHMPESRELREIADRAVVVPLTPGSEVYGALRPAFHGLARELGSDRVAAHAVVEAYLRIVLVEVYRVSLSEHDRGETGSPSHRVFADYSALVEAHFREHWKVADYARVLGVSRDRLGDICQRVRGMGPKQLIDRRITLEARLQLENSSNSIQEVAGLLGFATSAQFNRFFSRQVGRPPGVYRASYVEGGQASVTDPARPYDWP